VVGMAFSSRAKWRSSSSACCGVLENCLTPPTLSERRFLNSYPFVKFSKKYQSRKWPGLFPCSRPSDQKRPHMVRAITALIPFSYFGGCRSKKAQIMQRLLLPQNYLPPGRILRSRRGRWDSGRTGLRLRALKDILVSIQFRFDRLPHIRTGRECVGHPARSRHGYPIRQAQRLVVRPGA
jgi:hypothetical protein